VSSDPRDKAVCVYCASSGSIHAEYLDAAFRLGAVLASNRYTTVYGGGRRGSMGAVANGALANGGRVVGVIPKFMQELEWGHDNLSELHVVDDMHARKHRFLALSHAVVALPGGSGTLEELLEAITLKRLGLFLGPIILVNTREYFAPLIQMFAAAVAEKFMDPRHAQMWQVVPEPENVPEALRTARPWSEDARSFAAL
jgi:uncharacterized protein (TIGR00730 family)